MLEANEYFDGKVKSIGFSTATLPATVGVMLPGEYEFPTSKKTMTIVSGSMKVKLPESNSWEIFNKNDHFIVEANKKFQLIIDLNTAYLCTYE